MMQRHWKLGLLWMLTASMAHATIIEFGNVSSTIPFNYASFVDTTGTDSLGHTGFNLTHGATPNIAVEMFTADASGAQTNNLFVWGSSYGSLINVAYHNLGEYALIRFTGTGGYLAQLHGFKMGGWPNTNRILPLLEIRVDNSTLFSQTNILISGSSFTQFTFDPTVYRGNQIEIFFGNDWNVGIDDIEFSQFIPEPASLLALGAGLVGLVRRRRR